MSASTFAVRSSAPRPAYAAGRCNIGPAEIARRRRFGHLGLLASVGLLLLLLAGDAPREARLLLFFPATGSTVGYLQARLRFCAAFGLLGIFNFGALGESGRVADREALARDRRAAAALVAASAVIGLGAAGVAFLL